MSDTGTNNNEGTEEKHPKIWGIFYILLGLAGMTFSGYSLIQSLGMVPLFGTITAGILIGLLSLLIIIYGFRVFKKDY